MSPVSSRSLALACAGLCALAALGAPGDRPIEARFQAPEPPSVALSELWAEPLDHLGRRVRFVIQCESHPESWNPYVTRFGSGDYGALSVWSDEQRLWRAEDWNRPLGLVFYRRSSQAARALAPAPALARFAVVGNLRQVFLGRPWIEIESAVRLEEALTEGTVLHASRGVQLMESREWRLAAEDFERALAPELPARARQELEALRDACRAREAEPPPGD